MRGMPSVATDSTCVSPRWKSPEPCTVGEHADLGRERPEVGRAATVDADALVDDAAAHDFLLQRAERLLDLAASPGELAGLVVGADERRGAGRRWISSRRSLRSCLVGDGHRLGGVRRRLASATAANTSAW